VSESPPRNRTVPPFTARQSNLKIHWRVFPTDPLGSAERVDERKLRPHRLTVAVFAACDQEMAWQSVENLFIDLAIFQ
jgi:hypothetical protein